MGIDPKMEHNMLFPGTEVLYDQINFGTSESIISVGTGPRCRDNCTVGNWAIQGIGETQSIKHWRVD
jgi:hypothetical protein